MDFIKKFFEEFKTPKYEVKDWPSFSYSAWEEEMKAPCSLYFTQAEKNYLQRLLADKINEQEGLRQEILYDAQQYKKYGNTSAARLNFKEHRKTKADIKKLVALQKKIKHTLATRG